MKTKIKIKYILFFVSIVIFLSNHSFSQNKSIETDDLLTVEKRSAIIDKVIEVFNEYYPLPGVAADMVKYINQKRIEGKYDQFTDLTKFTSQLQIDLRSISNDQHIRVSPYEKLPDDLLAEMRLGSPDDNYGFQKVERLPGNIGYIELTSFNNPRSAGLTAIAAMNFVAHCDALIIDLRLNGGGDESMAQFLSSYFFDKSTHLTDYYIRKDERTEQRWTQEWVPGPKKTDVPIYILLSNFSYSSAEVFSYQLQQLGRAVIIGEKTRGGAHGVRYMSFQELSINLRVPYSRDINPYSKTNYIDGVIPDVAVSSDKALIVANIEASKKLLETETNKEKRYKLEWTLSGYEADLNPLDLDDGALSEYVGIYENVEFILECGKLYERGDDKTKHELIPMGNDQFKYREKKEVKFRIQFSRDEKGKVIEFYWHDNDGDKHPIKIRKYSFSDANEEILLDISPFRTSILVPKTEHKMGRNIENLMS
jgi:C-terminal processing protease CtpA/Prc